MPSVQNLAEMTPEKLSAIIDRQDDEKVHLKKILSLSNKEVCSISSFVICVFPM